MKKYISILFGAVVALASCTKAEIAEPVVLDGETVFTCELPGTKIAAGDKVDGLYKAVWEAKDSLFVKNAATGASLGVAHLSEGAGSNIATFTLSQAIENGTSVVLTYGKSSTVAAQQKISSAKSLAGLTYAQSEAVTVNNGAAAFALTHSPAIIKVAVSSSELAGAKLNSIVFRSMGEAVTASSDFVKATVSDKPALSTDLKEFWFTTSPVDLSGKALYVAFDVTATDGNTYVIPVQFNGKQIKANTVNSVTVSGLKLADCVSWYEPKENRHQGGLGYAYGDANTYLIQCKNGSTYSDGVYSANAKYPESVTIDTKARGDFSYVVDPTGATFEFCKLGSIPESAYNGTGDVYTFRFSDIKGATNVDPTKYSITDNGNGSVTVKNDAAFVGAPILMMVKNGKILWSWTFWNIAADGTELAEMDFAGAKLANLLIGQSSNQATWVSHTGTSFLHTVNYYQWGRTIPIFWQSFYSFRYYGMDNTNNVPAIAGPIKMADSFIPGMITPFGKSGVEMGPWSTDAYADLWQPGMKSVYDPCPKGWRVADEEVYNAASAALFNKTLTVKYQNTALKHGIFVSTDPDVLLINAGYIQDKLGAADISGRPSNYGNSATGAGNSNGRYWTSKVGGATANQARAFMFSSSGNATGNATGGTDGNFRSCGLNRSGALPVRCQVDTDNR